LALLVVVATTVPRSPVRAQAMVGFDGTLASRYVSRGLVRKNGWVAQPSLYFAMPVANHWLSAGVWSDVELQPAGRNDLTDVGARRVGVGEVDGWLDASLAVGSATASLGWTAYRYPSGASPAGRDRRWNTSEVYSTLALRSPAISPRLSVWWDVSRVRGAYIEGSAVVPVAPNPFGRPFWVVFLGVLAGYNLGQGPNASRPSELANFAGRGLTHVDVSAAFYLHLPAIPLPRSAQVACHLQFNRDDATRRHSLAAGGLNRATTLWLTATLSAPSFGRGN
jgi:hypothetical protein